MPDAHPSTARSPGVRRLPPRFVATALVACLLAAALPGGTLTPVAAAAAAEAGRTATRAPTPRSEAQARAELERVRTRIRTLTERVQDDVARTDAVAAEVRDADRRLGSARARLAEVRRARTEAETRRAALARERARAAAALAAERESLAAHLRAAYAAGRDEQLKVLLNADDPARLARMLVYYERLGAARAARLATLRQRAATLEALDDELATATARLAEAEARHARELAVVDAARAARERSLRGLQARVASGRGELRQLRADARALEGLVEELRAALAQLDDGGFVAPGGPRRAFEQLRGRLSWPARGRVVARYGDARPGGLRWHGMLVETAAGAPVRAPYHGRVVYADWLSGLGLLLILDHGGGYLSLYGHNAELRRRVGDRVAPGDLLATSGGQGTGARPELYFEIRRGTRPVDPRPWFRGAP